MNVSMRTHKKVCRQRLVFSLTAISFLVTITALYVFFTLPTQGVYTLSVNDGSSETSALLKGSNQLFKRSRFLEQRKLFIEPDNVYLFDRNDEAFVAYARLVKHLDYLDDFLRAATKAEISGRYSLEQALRITRSARVLTDALVDGTDQVSGKFKARQVIQTLNKNLWQALNDLQHPKSCTGRKAIKCLIENPHGFGAGLGEMLECLQVGLQKNLTVILDTDGWHYTGDIKWDDVFLPLSSCKLDQIVVVDQYPKQWDLERRHVLKLPDTIATDLVAFHGDPVAWFHGILVSYIIRPEPDFQRELDETVKNIDADLGYVGLHIRRTDKKSEAQLYDVSAYMQHADDYFEKESLRRDLVEKRIFVATDDVAVLNELRERYPSYKFFDNKASARQAGLGAKARATGAALKNIMRDIWTLSRSQYLIITMSSGFGRTAYNLMHNNVCDGWQRTKSIDIDYFYAFATFPDRIPIEPEDEHQLNNEVSFYRSPKSEDLQVSYKQASDFFLGVSKNKPAPDGFTPTNDLQKVQAKFKTELPVRTMPYLTYIAPFKTSQ